MVKYISLDSVFCMCKELVSPAPFIKECVFPQCVFNLFLKNQIAEYAQPRRTKCPSVHTSFFHHDTSKLAFQLDEKLLGLQVYEPSYFCS